MPETEYARPISFADVNGCRIERIFVKDAEQEEIRFSWWPNGRFALRPLDLPESELLTLVGEAIRQGVFTPDFLARLRDLLGDDIVGRSSGRAPPR